MIIKSDLGVTSAGDLARVRIRDNENRILVEFVEDPEHWPLGPKVCVTVTPNQVTIDEFECDQVTGKNQVSTWQHRLSAMEASGRNNHSKGDHHV